MDEWLQNVANYLVRDWGLSPKFAVKVSPLLAYMVQYNLDPQITSGYRDGSKQMAMRAAWDAGNRAGLRARPAASSQHTKVAKGFLSTSAAAEAIDIKTRDEKFSAEIARYLGIGTGLDFKDPDPGHYFLRSI